MNKKPISYMQTDKRWANKPYRVPGAFEVKANAERMRDELRGKGYDGFIQEVTV